MATSSTTTGINISGIEKLKKAISDYQTAIKKKANIGAKKSLIEKAIKGTKSEAALKTLCDRIETEINSMIKDLDKYSKYLNTLSVTYKKADNDNKSFETKVGTSTIKPGTPIGHYSQIQSDYGVPPYPGSGTPIGHYSQIQSDYGVPPYPGSGTPIGHYSQIQSDYGVPPYPGSGTPIGHYSQIQSDYGVPPYPGSGTPVGHSSQVQSYYGVPPYQGTGSYVQTRYGVPGYSCDKK